MQIATKKEKINETEFGSLKRSINRTSLKRLFREEIEGWEREENKEDELFILGMKKEITLAPANIKK